MFATKIPYLPMQETSANTNPNIENININNFFDNMVGKLRYDEQMFVNDIMPQQDKSFYSCMIDGNVESISFQMRETTSQYFIINLIGDYMKNLLASKKSPKKIAFELSDSNVLVWAEIYSDDEEMENALILSQAKANAKFSKFGFHVSTTIVEESDGLEVPSHYKTIPVSAQ